MSEPDTLERAARQRRIVHMLSALRVVSAHMVNQRSDDDEDALHLAGRIGAIGRAALAGGHGLDLESLVLDELAAHAVKQDRYVVQGADVHLYDDTAHLMSLAVHELATNSIKYGALAHPEAALRVSWRLAAYAQTQRLHFEWLEQRTSPAVVMQNSKGFGSTLVQNLISRKLQGRGEFSFSDSGMRCIIEIPLNDTLNRDEQ